MSERIPLKDSILLRRIYGNGQERFTIQEVRGKGSSVLCYSALSEGMGQGILKELYPERFAGSLKRDVNGQLIPSGDDDALYLLFTDEISRYLKPYNILLNIKKNRSNRELNNFIPVFELYEGCVDGESSHGTVYAWFPQSEITTFQSILDDPKLNENPDEKLHIILKIMHRLTNCICTLHSEQLIHRDINPNNFGLTVTQDGQILVDTLSLSDIDTVSYIFDEDHTAVGSPGFIEPESGIMAFKERTDIYSIGATLFNAVVITDETRQLYNDRYYERLEDLVAASELIQASPKNADHKICGILVRILTRCLSRRHFRYNSCEELRDDLGKALEIWEKLGSYEEIQKREKELEEKRSAFDMLYHFYKYPLYDNVDKSSDELRVLLLGFTGYSCNYLDALLQMGQMINKRLYVTIVSDKYQLFKEYKSHRPALEEFFDIDMMMFDTNEDEIYGHIMFQQRELYAKRSGKLVPDKEKILAQLREFAPHRVFISMENDAMNVTVAKYCAKCPDCMITFASTGSSSVVCADKRATSKLKDSDEYPEIERMAFNAHLVWSNDLYGITEQLIKDFSSNYYSDSSISNVFSIKYKLYRAGIDLDEPGMTPHRAAELFMEKLHDSGEESLRDYLIWTEHRRWVTEKVCGGWRLMDDLSQCPIGDTKYTKDKIKLHTCLVRSRPGCRLSKLVSENPSNWEDMSDEDYESLDDLDRLSYNLHKRYRAMADDIRPSRLLRSPSIQFIENMARSNPKVNSAYQEWFVCITDIVNGKATLYNQYKRLTESLKSEFKSNYPPKKYQRFKKELDAFNEDFLPVLEAYHYKIIKDNDVGFIDKIPFILTYDRKLELVIPYVTGSYSVLFENVAAASKVNPEYITYLYSAEDEKALIPLLESLPRIARFAAKKRMRAQFSLVIFLDNKLYDNSRKSIKERLVRASNDLLKPRNVQCLPLTAKTPLSQRITKMLVESGKKHSVALQYFGYTYNGMSGFLYGAGVYDVVEHFSFDSNSQKFVDVSSCCAVKYISQWVEMSVEDMMAFGLSISNIDDQPAFYRDYKVLWDRYKKNPKTWKALCKMLGAYDESSSTIVEFIQNAPGKAITRTYRVSDRYYDSIRKIIENLIQYGIVCPGSKVEYVSDFCAITIIDSQNHDDEFRKLFYENRTKLISEADVYCFPKQGRDGASVVIKWEENLNVTGFSYAAGYESYYKQYDDILRFWETKGYIHSLNISGYISFCYTSQSIKRLLTCGGRMLEVFVFHKLREQAAFDDVVSGCKINWGNDYRTENELDCVVTKGFRSIFIECKSTELKDEYYYKLDSLVKTLGVNAIPVIIDDDSGRNAGVRKERGENMNIYTITEPSEIDDIGNTILKLLANQP